ncbi:polysaccharide deacetylase family protein [Modestobacter sp. VKM Ac-2984]|uniref:polysaccharide deacetylase family protein n=1 Tax=Modestobacter sp. VKM Ac-2984 TaxID=3004138 RepID=UPI0022AAFA10|nr:polysaccharide deacetylase family protein [Modestobacter sp. VKM Ac-2984]MCZ2815409.1 polysaccharide deacetylase family protein [Modestobacter sp. VKM Ac-2984]
MRARRIRRCGRATRLAMAAVLAATGVLHGVVSAPAARAAHDCPPPVRTVLDQTPPVHPRTVALTFDDGPDPRWTPQLLDTLRAHGVKATFFLVGSQVEAHPELARRIVAEGHAIGNHTYSHPDLGGLSRAEQAAEIDRGWQAIEAVTGVRPCFFRAPYGIHRGASVQQLAWDRGMTIADWSHDPRDWESPSSYSPPFQERIVRGATTPALMHPIVLMHDSGEPGAHRENTVAAVARIVSFYAAAGHLFTDPAGQLFPEDPTAVGPGSIADGFSARWQRLFAVIRAAMRATMLS